MAGNKVFFFRPAEKESKEEHTRYKSVNTPEEGHKHSSRNVKAPSRFSYAAEYESSSEFEESSDDEDWESKECGGDEGSSDEYIGCDKGSRWYYKDCTTFEIEESHFECHSKDV